VETHYAPRKTQNAARRENFNHEQEGQLVVGGERVHHGNRRFWFR